MNGKHLSIAKYVHQALRRQVDDPGCVVSSRFNIPKTLLDLEIQTVMADGSKRPLVEVCDELGEKIRAMKTKK